MYLKIKTNYITDINSLDNPVSDVAVVITDRNGTEILTVPDVSALNPDPENNGTFTMQTDEGHAITDCKQWLDDNAILLYIPFKFVHNSASIGVKVVHNGITLYRSFTIYGIDLDIPLYLLANSIITTKTLSTFVEIHSPISNMKMLYKTNNSKSTNTFYTVDGVNYQGRDISFHARYNSTVNMTSIYKYSQNGVEHSVTHVSTSKDIYSYVFVPEIFIEKELIGTTLLKKGEKFKLKAHVDFTNQVTYYVNGVVNTPIDRNYSIEFQVKDASGILLANHIDVTYKATQPEVVIVSSEEITVETCGKHNIGVIYHNLGLNPHRNLTTYPVGIYMKMYDSNNPMGVGDVIEITEPTVKSLTLVLIPVVTTLSNIDELSYYYDPIVADEITLGLDITEEIPAYTGLAVILPILSDVVEDYIDVEDYVIVSQTKIDSYKVSNVYSQSLTLRVYKLEDEGWITSETAYHVMQSGDSIDLMLSNGIYKLEIRDKGDYAKDYIIISYADILDAEMKFSTMLLNDCVGKDIDYRQFYDFTAFQFLLEIFYKIVTTNQNFYYIYSGTMGDTELTQLYTANAILKRLNEYVDEYTRKGTNIGG